MVRIRRFAKSSVFLWKIRAQIPANRAGLRVKALGSPSATAGLGSEVVGPGPLPGAAGRGRPAGASSDRGQASAAGGGGLGTGGGPPSGCRGPGAGPEAEAHLIRRSSGPRPPTKPTTPFLLIHRPTLHSPGMSSQYERTFPSQLSISMPFLTSSVAAVRCHAGLAVTIILASCVGNARLN